ncbi:MAG: DUF4411 family protein [Candidatus Brocadiaceae bacterium]|nr:DUF4411 family protein [Candidatus Brocadiaceae bacterium]
MNYLFDANVFIQAKNLHYGLDFCPAFWDWLIENNKARKVFSIEKVGDELEAGNDELASWATARGADFFLKPDTRTVGDFANVSNWVTSQDYEPAAISTFLQIADYYLLAHALAHRFTVITHEKPDNSTKKIKIPNACIGLGIKCMSPYEILRHEKARFVLEGFKRNFR